MQQSLLRVGSAREVLLYQPGERIGDWVVVRMLGEGGMGAVFECHNVLSERMKAAVKVMKPHDLGESKKRFVRELELLAAVNHPAVVRVLGGGEDAAKGYLYMAMELLDGQELGDRLTEGPLSWEEAAAYFQQLGAGLLAAHQLGVTHRDIKPQNIWLCGDGTAKLLDFGIAVQAGGTKLTRQGAVPGTLAYMAPEIFEGTKPDHPADIYALGQVLWECLTGKEAFPEADGMSAEQTMARTMGMKITMEALDPGESVPAPLRELCKRTTDPEPESRMHDLHGFLELLGETGVSGNAPVPRRRPTQAQRTGAPAGPDTGGNTFALDLEQAGDNAMDPEPFHQPPAKRRSGALWMAGGAGLLVVGGGSVIALLLVMVLVIALMGSGSSTTTTVPQQPDRPPAVAQQQQTPSTTPASSDCYVSKKREAIVAQLPIELTPGRCVDQAIRRSDKDTLKTNYVVQFSTAPGTTYEQVVSDLAPKMTVAGFSVDRPPLDFTQSGYTFSGWTSDRSQLMSVSLRKEHGEVVVDLVYQRPLVAN